MRSKPRGGSWKALPLLRKRSAVVLASVAVFAAAGAVAACNAVLGLDAPQLDPCASDGCVDGTAPPTTGDAGLDAPALLDSTLPIDAPTADADAGIDAQPDTGPINGVRCGGGSSPAIGCNGDTPVCCLTLDAGPASYSCVHESSACSGYAIDCATDNDCPGSEVCCHFNSSIKCEDQTACANDSLVCDPDGGADQCPTGYTCSVAFTSGSYTLPYYGCTQ